MISSASPRIGVIRDRSSRIPSLTDRSGASGCGRRVSLNRRTRVGGVGFEKNQHRIEAAQLAEPLENLRELRQEIPLAHVDDDSHLLDAAAAQRELRQSRESASSEDCRRRNTRDLRARGWPETFPNPDSPVSTMNGWLSRAGWRRSGLPGSRCPGRFTALPQARALLPRRPAARGVAARRPPPATAARVAERLLEPRRKLARRMMAARAQQLVSRRDLDENGNAPPRRNRHADHRHAQAQNLEKLVVQPEPFVLARGIPSFQLHDQLDALGRSRRGDAEQILDVDHAEPAQLHVMPRELRAGADQDRFGAPPDVDRVVGDQSMAADDQVEGTFALADAAVADDQHAEAENIHQHGVHARSCSASQSSRIDVSLAIAIGVATGVLSSGRFARSASTTTSAGGVKPPVMSTQGKSSVSASRSDGERGRGLQAFEIADLALAENQHAPRFQVLVKAGQRQPGLLDVGAGDPAVEAGGAGQDLEGRPTDSGRLPSSAPTVTPGSGRHRGSGRSRVAVQARLGDTVDATSRVRSARSPFRPASARRSAWRYRTLIDVRSGSRKMTSAVVRGRSPARRRQPTSAGSPGARRGKSSASAARRAAGVRRGPARGSAARRRAPRAAALPSLPLAFHLFAPAARSCRPPAPATAPTLPSCRPRAGTSRPARAG